MGENEYQETKLEVAMKDCAWLKGFFRGCALFLLALLVLGRSAGAVEIYSEDFDGFSRDWVCCLADCALDPGVPPGYTEFHSNVLGLNYGQCNCQITTEADRGSGGRGLRINLEEDAWPTGENVLKKDLGEDYRLLFIRWYMRESTTDFTNFEKLFRIKQASGQILIPEWKAESGHVYMNLWDANTSANHLFEDFDLKTEVEVGQWTCYEIKIDLDAKNAELWVDGVSRGTLTDQPWLDGWVMRNIEIGGNQYGHTWSEPVEHPRDYDDIVIATEQVGCDDVPPADEDEGDEPVDAVEPAETTEPLPEPADASDPAADASIEDLQGPDAAADPAPDAAADPLEEESDGGGDGCGCIVAA
jgi:hypothetical protein